MSGELSLDTLTTSQSGKELTINTIAAQLEAAVTGQTPVDMTAGDTNLTAAQLKRLNVIIVSGATAAHILTLAPVKRMFAVVNNNTAALTVKMGTTSVGVSTGGTAIMICDGTTNGLLAFTGGGGGGALSTLSDVVLSSPADGDVLTYDGGTSKWKNKTPGGATDSSLYWRIICHTNGGGSLYSIAELAFKTGGTRTDPTSALASSVYAGDISDYGPLQMFDSDPSTSWASGTTTPDQTVDMTFAAAESFTSITLTPPAPTSDTRMPLTFTICTSVDGTSWTTGQDITASTWGTVQAPQTFSLTSAVYT